jgi:hypothetical protein
MCLISWIHSRGSENAKDVVRLDFRHGRIELKFPGKLLESCRLLSVDVSRVPNIHNILAANTGYGSLHIRFQNFRCGNSKER